jgi:two-component system sensor histidine kinase FlrB
LGGEPGQIVLLADVTETRRLQDQAARLERIGALGRTVSGLAHQIRTPLGAALLHATNLPRGRARDRVVERLRALEDLVNDMLTYTRQGEFNVEVLDVDVLLNELACAQGDRTTKVMVGRSSTQRRALVRGNRTALASAMQNLIDNALEADPNATVSLSTSVAHAGEEICLRCTDDGPGIPGELRERIFEPFFSTRLDGTGLGLAIVRSIIDAHGGRIEFDRSSMCGPRGTTFLITLPAIADLDSVVHGNALCDA